VVLVSTARIIHGRGVVVVGMAADILQFPRFHLHGAVYPRHERVARAGGDANSRQLPEGEPAMLLGGLGSTRRRASRAAEIRTCRGRRRFTVRPYWEIIPVIAMT
jgi:hypothetical protein